MKQIMIIATLILGITSCKHQPSETVTSTEVIDTNKVLTDSMLIEELKVDTSKDTVIVDNLK